jgi:hypothetical protein
MTSKILLDIHYIYICITMFIHRVLKFHEKKIIRSNKVYSRVNLQVNIFKSWFIVWNKENMYGNNNNNNKLISDKC